MTITPTYKFPSGYMGGHLPLAPASLFSFLLTYLLTSLQSPLKTASRTRRAFSFGSCPDLRRRCSTAESDKAY